MQNRQQQLNKRPSPDTNNIKIGTQNFSEFQRQKDQSFRSKVHFSANKIQISCHQNQQIWSIILYMMEPWYNNYVNVTLIWNVSNKIKINLE